MKKYLVNIHVGRAVSSFVVLFLVLCMSIMPAIATASSDNNEMATIGDDKALQATSTQNNTSVPDDQSMNYLIAEVNYVDDTLELIDANTSMVVSSMKVGYGPISVMPCPGTMDAAVLLTNHHDTQKIVILNLTTQEVKTNVFLTPADKGGIGTISDEGSVDHIFWRHDGRYMYVITDTYLAVFDTWTGKVQGCFDAVGSRVAADMNSDGSALLMFRKVKANTYIVDRLNTTSNVIEKSKMINLNFDATNVGPLRYSPDGTKAYTYIDDMGLTGFIGVEPNLIIIDDSTLNVEMVEDALPTVKAASRTNRMDLEISPDGNRLYMLYSICEPTKFYWAEILTYNLGNRTYENTFYSDSREIGGITLSPDGSKIYTANYCDYWARMNTISILNSTSGEVIGHISVDYGPIDVKTVQVAKEWRCCS